MTTVAEHFLIVNADDFGLTSGINQGIIEAHENGLVTSASLMVRGEAAEEAAAYARNNERLSVGLHLDLAEWVYFQGEWTPRYQVIDTNDARAVQAECERQLAMFEKLLSRPPSHLDSHQHQHLSEPVRSIALELAALLGVPVRSCTPAIGYCGSFYGQLGEGAAFHEAITIESLVALIENLPEGWTELGCHPGYANGLESVYCAEREQELRVLCSRPVQEAVRRTGVLLCSFKEARSSTRLHAG